MKKEYILVLAFLVPALLLEGQSDSEPVAPLTIFVVYPEEQADTGYFSSGEFNDLGYVGSQPDLVAEQFSAVLPSVSLERIVNPISGATKEEPRYSVRINFVEEDRLRFASLSKQHQGSRFLIEVLGKPVYAPSVGVPITHGWINIPVESSADAEALAEDLRPFIRERKDGEEEG